MIDMKILLTNRGEGHTFANRHTSRVVRLISFASGSFVPGYGLVVPVIPKLLDGKHIVRSSMTSGPLARHWPAIGGGGGKCKKRKF